MRVSIILFSLFAFTLAGCAIPPGDSSSPQASNPAEVYPDLGEAPELTNEVWLNTAAPLRLSKLRGKVVLLDMWTFT